MFNTEFSILLNIEKIPILKFNNTEIFGITTTNTELTDELNFKKKKFKKKFFFFFGIFFQKFSVFLGIFDIFRYFPVFSGIFRDSILKIIDIGKKKEKKKSEIFLKLFFPENFRTFTGFSVIFGISGLPKI